MKLIQVTLLLALISCGSEKSVSGSKSKKESAKPGMSNSFEIVGKWESGCIQEAPIREIKIEFKNNGDMVKETNYFGGSTTCAPENVQLTSTMESRYVLGKPVEKNILELDLTDENGEKMYYTLKVEGNAIYISSASSYSPDVRPISFNAVEKLIKK